VSWLETQLRSSPLEPLVFGTPVFAVCCSGARSWYRLRQRFVASDAAR
jgi:hypothetical protein